MGIKTWFGLKPPHMKPDLEYFVPTFHSQLSRRYLYTNAGYGRPIALKLTQRGFYSEINNLLNAMLYGLIKRRRLVVDLSEFEGLQWSDFFVSKLPTGHLEGIDIPWVIIGARTPKFWKIHRYVTRRHNRRIPIALPSMRLYGSIRHIKRELAFMLFAPHEQPETIQAPYAAFHIRRGDKITHAGGETPEGEDTGPQTYIDMLKGRAPDIRSTFVMTDDYTAFEQLQQIAPEYRFTTHCHPDERGYDQDIFSARTPQEKVVSLRRLLLETQVAMKSDLFLGGFKSNIGRFITLVHDRPEVCFSVDSLKDWHPG